MSLMFTIKSAAVTGLFWVDFFFCCCCFFFCWLDFFFCDSDLSKIVLLLGAMDCG